MNVGETILAQLGGNRFIAMTGARLLVNGENFLQFSMPKAKDKSNKCRITLAPADLYTLETFHVRGADCKALSVEEGIYADQLQATFTKITGFDTHL